MADVETVEEFGLTLLHGLGRLACGLAHEALGLVKARVGAPIHLRQPPLWVRCLLWMILLPDVVSRKVMVVAGTLSAR